MAQSLAPIEAAFAKIGADLTDAHKAQLVTLFENVADPNARAIMDTLASHVVMHGLAGTFQGTVRSDITSSEADIVALINANIVGGVNALDAWLREVADSIPPK